MTIAKVAIKTNEVLIDLEKVKEKLVGWRQRLSVSKWVSVVSIVNSN
jgi:hypothetical protein